jgi:hypothetical protein
MYKNTSTTRLKGNEYIESWNIESMALVLERIIEITGTSNKTHKNEYLDDTIKKPPMAMAVSI